MSVYGIIGCSSNREMLSRNGQEECHDYETTLSVIGLCKRIGFGFADDPARRAGAGMASQADQNH